MELALFEHGNATSNSFANVGDHGKGLAKNTCKQIRWALRIFKNWLVEKGHIHPGKLNCFILFYF